MRAARLLVGLLVAFGLGCGGTGSTLEIRPRGSLTDPADLAGLRLVVNGLAVAAQDFGADGSGLAKLSLAVPDDGTLEVRVELLQAGQPAASGVATWPLAEDHEWGLDVFRQVADPAATCFGCSGSARIVLAPWAQRAPGEAIWLAWGGVPRGSDIVF